MRGESRAGPRATTDTTLAPCPAEAALGVPEVLPEIVTQDGSLTLTLRDAVGPAAKPTHRPAKVHVVSADGSAVVMTEHLLTLLETKTTCFVMPATAIDLDWDNIAFDPNGGRLFAVHGDNAGSHLKVWSVATGALEATGSSRGAIVPLAASEAFLYRPTLSSPWRVLDLSGRPTASDPVVRDVAFEVSHRTRSTRDGRILFDPRADATTVWDLASTSFDLLDQNGADITAWALANDDRTLATGDALGHVLLFDLRRKKPLPFALARPQGIVSLTFSADGRVLVSASDDRTVTLTRVETGRPLATLDMTKRNDVATKVWFADQGRTLVLATSMGARFRYDVRFGSSS